MVGAPTPFPARGVGIVVAALLVHRVVVHHGVHVARRHEKAQARLAELGHAGRVAPIGLGDNAHLVAVGLQHAGNDGRAEGGMVDVGVAGDVDEINLIPAAGLGLGATQGQKRRRRQGGLRDFAIGGSRSVAPDGPLGFAPGGLRGLAAGEPRRGVTGGPGSPPPVRPRFSTLVSHRCPFHKNGRGCPRPAMSSILANQPQPRLLVPRRPSPTRTARPVRAQPEHQPPGPQPRPRRRAPARRPAPRWW